MSAKAASGGILSHSPAVDGRGIDHLMGILDCGMRRVFGWPLALLVVNVPSVSIHPVKCSCEDGAELPSQFSPWV